MLHTNIEQPIRSPTLKSANSLRILFSVLLDRPGDRTGDVLWVVEALCAMLILLSAPYIVLHVAINPV